MNETKLILCKDQCYCSGWLKGEKAQSFNVRNDRGNIITDITDIRRLIREY